jgi:methionyl aminopeptidase
MTIFLKSPEHIENIRRAGKIASSVLSALPFYLKPGITTKYIDGVVEQMIKDLGGTAPCKGYVHGNLPPFSAASCISVNSQAVHCEPSNLVIKESDVVKVDLVVGYNGWCADTARTYLVGAAKPEIKTFVETCYLSMWEGLKKAIDGNKVNDIGKAIEDFVRPSGYSISKQFVGHGIGRGIHEDPRVPSFYLKEADQLICSGMVLAIEPILFTTADSEVVFDGWNTTAKQNGLVSHFEHTCLITPAGKPEILTLREEEKQFLSNLL